MAALRANARKVVCIGRNYAAHAYELNNKIPTQPFFFLKPTTAILPPGAGPVLRPASVDLRHEVELALIMGSELRNLSKHNEQAAYDAIEGYAVAIDMTAGNMQEDAKRKGLPWTLAKGFDTFLPISNFIPKHKIPDPHSVRLHLSVNNVIRQSDSTDLMLYRIPHLLRAISHVMTLEKGDIVLTGTPKGVRAVQRNDFITAGVQVDRQEIEEGRIEVRIKDRAGFPVYLSEQKLNWG
ncbi:MAG: hypothetical protein M1816_002115 [Peltula sp. TS41687]|nr:MAG: hypothetical protein M1816_002115 [Peltula sp. TS41687]